VETVQTDQDVDQLVWSIIKDSRNPKDFLVYVRHAEGRDAGHDVALDRARALWPANADATALFPSVIEAMELLASHDAVTSESTFGLTIFGSNIVCRSQSRCCFSHFPWSDGRSRDIKIMSHLSLVFLKNGSPPRAGAGHS